MDTINSAITYFDRRASNYSAESAQFPWSFFRARELRAVNSLLRIPPHSEVLEIGCGSGFYTRFLVEKKLARVTAVEPSNNMAQQAKPYCENLIVSSLENTHLSQRYLYLVCAGALEFMPDLDRAWHALSQCASLHASIAVLYPKAGIRGLLYKYVHERNGCPTHIVSSKSFIAIAGRHRFIVKKHISASAISDAYQFEYHGY